jgi:peroxiredoxin Q/BCP
MKLALIAFSSFALFSCITLVAKAKKEKPTALKVGDTAPNFTLPNEKGESVTFHDIPGKKVLYYYPMDSTPGCTKQACSLRDGHKDLTNKGITVVGISSDSVASHQKFAKNHKLPFTLLSDTKNEVAKLYGTAGTFINSRITFLVDEKNKIVKILKDIHVKSHAQQILKEFGLEKTPNNPPTKK